MLTTSRAVVRLDRLAANARAVRERVAPAAVLAAVKADAYGHGAVAVSRLLQAEGLADAFGVATVAEALELRDGGITLPILKLSPVVTGEQARACVEADVATACGSPANAVLLAEAAAAVGRPAVVHLKVDTGMRRVGAEQRDAADLAALAEGLGLAVEGVFTHLPVADEPARTGFTAAQADRFREVVDAVHARLGRELPFVHLANSAAVLTGLAPWCTMVRPGIVLYGYLPDPAMTDTLGLQPVLEWRSHVSFVKEVPAGEGVGYGLTWTTPRPTTIATVPVGYADGFPRLASNRASVLVGGVSCPVVGRVCMDQLMVEAPAGTTVGDDVVLMGTDGDAGVSADDLARAAETISYEVLCGLSPRVERAYAP